MRQQIRFCTSADGTKIAYAVSGSGPPLLLTTTWVTRLEYGAQMLPWNSWHDALSRGGIGKQWAADVAEPIARGFEAFARDDWAGAIDAMAPVVTALVRIGGSRAQRDLIENSLLAAYLHAGRPADARALLAKRIDRRPTVPVAGLQAV